MRINRLTVFNFRNFKENTFAFHRRFTLLVGDNGAGKTAVLDALRVGVCAYLLGIPDSQAPSIRREFVRRETRRDGEFSTFEPVMPCAVRCEGRVHRSDLYWDRELASINGRTNRVGARALVQCVDRHIRGDGTTADFPLIVSYGTGRLWIEPRATKYAHTAIRSARYRGSEPIGALSNPRYRRSCCAGGSRRWR